MNIEFNLVSLAGLGIGAAALAGGLVGLNLKNRVPGLGFRDTARAMVYVTQYDAALEYYGLRRREVRACVDELRVNLVESAADGGVEAAIARLGPPRAMAAEVAGVRMAPSWLRGLLWLSGAVAIGLIALGLSTSAFLGAVESLASPGETATWHSIFVTMTAKAGTGGVAASFGVELPFVTVATLVVPFLVGARVWRLWTGRSERTAVASGR